MLLDGLTVAAARLPWRREGELEPLTGPAPELGADSGDLLAGCTEAS